MAELEELKKEWRELLEVNIRKGIEESKKEWLRRHTPKFNEFEDLTDDIDQNIKNFLCVYNRITNEVLRRIAKDHEPNLSTF